ERAGRRRQRRETTRSLRARDPCPLPRSWRLIAQQRWMFHGRDSPRGCATSISVWAGTACLTPTRSRRADSNRGPLHYETLKPPGLPGTGGHSRVQTSRPRAERAPAEWSRVHARTVPGASTLRPRRNARAVHDGFRDSSALAEPRPLRGVCARAGGPGWRGYGDWSATQIRPWPIATPLAIEVGEQQGKWRRVSLRITKPVVGLTWTSILRSCASTHTPLAGSTASVPADLSIVVLVVSWPLV